MGQNESKSVPTEGLEREAHYAKACLDRLSGRLPEALKEIEWASQDYKTRALRALPELHLRALIALEMGQEEKFEKRAEEIRSLIEQEQNPKMMRVYYHLLGLREL